MIKIIINAEKVGIKYIVLPLVDNGSIRSDKQEKLLILEIKKILKVIKNNTKILFETDYSPNKIVKLMKKFHSKKVGINYDTEIVPDLVTNLTKRKNILNMYIIFT